MLDRPADRLSWRSCLLTNCWDPTWGRTPLLTLGGKMALLNMRCWSEELGTRWEKKRASGRHDETGAATRSGFPARGGTKAQGAGRASPGRDCLRARNVSYAEPPSAAGWLHVRLRRRTDGIRESGSVVGSIVR